MTEPEQKHRKVYGRGLFDGLRLAGINNPEIFVNEAKLAKQEQALNGAAKKVLEAVPLTEAWTLQQIASEIRRIGSTMGFQIVEACVHNLVERGLVKEPERGTFRRLAAKPKIHVVESIKDMKIDPTPLTTTPQHSSQPEVAPKRPETLDRMSALAAAAREAAARMTALSKEIEDVAIEVEERIQRIEADTAKLKQLQALLKSIGA